MAQQLASLSSQRGASVTSIILALVIIVVTGKLFIAIVPAQIGDYQLTQVLSNQLHEANSVNETAEQFVERVNRQMSINADYDISAKDIFTFTNNETGQLAIHKQYSKTNNFFANVDIVNRFEGDIEPTPAK